MDGGEPPGPRRRPTAPRPRGPVELVDATGPGIAVTCVIVTVGPCGSRSRDYMSPFKAQGTWRVAAKAWRPVDAA